MAMFFGVCFIDIPLGGMMALDQVHRLLKTVRWSLLHGQKVSFFHILETILKKKSNRITDSVFGLYQNLHIRFVKHFLFPSSFPVFFVVGLAM